jgi:DNA polymerase
MKHILSLDIEDFSPVDIKYGVYKRAESGEIILLAYSLDYSPVEVIDLTSEEMPEWLFYALTDPEYIKKAFNAPYERNYLNITLGIYSPPEQWECTQARAAMCGLPLSLDDASKALGLIEKKDPIGKSLIRYFCMPCKPTAANGMRTRNLPEHDPEKWEQFKSYNGQDVVVEQNVDKACQWYKIPAVEHHIWCLNERKNERGVMVDMELIDSAIIINKEFREELIEEATELSGLSNVNSPKQLKEWLSAEMEEEVTTLNKLAVRQMLIDEEDPAVRRILQIRQLMSKSSITKYLALKYGACEDLRVRGMIQYYGANRTGREAGRGPQPQNFPRIDEDFAKLLDDTRELVRQRDTESLHMVFPNLSNILSQLLRPTFVAAPGKEFIVLDFSSIESLASACLAGEQWRIDFFKQGGDIYKASGAMMFHKPIEQITKEDRQKSKVSELLFQYGGGEKAMERNNDTIEDPKKRIPVAEIPGLVKTWRKANPTIVQMWWDMDAAAKLAINTGQLVPVKNGVSFGMKNGNLLMKLPSGRCLVYQKAFLQKFYIAKVPVVDDKLIPKIHFDEENNPYVKFLSVKIGKVQKDTPEEYQYLLKRAGLAYDTSGFNEYLRQFGLTYEKPKPGKRETVCFWGMDGIWKVIETYGPKTFENLVQGACRDLLMNSIINIEKAGYPVVLSVHDEVVVEIPKDSVSFDKVKEIMLQLPDWASWWPVRADGFIGDYYMK